MQRVLQVNQLPQVVRFHVFGLSGADLDFGNRNQDLVADDFHLRRTSFRSHALHPEKIFNRLVLTIK